MCDLRKKSNERPVIGTCCLSTSPEFFAATKSAGLDFVFIDTEHVALPRDKLSWMCRAYAAAEIAPIVRVPEPEPFRVCEYIDGGALGIVAPYVESVEQVLSLVGAVKLRPLKGDLLARCLHVLSGPRAKTGVVNDPASLYSLLEGELGSDRCSYLQKKNASLQLFINIESTPALHNLEHLLSVPGLDGVFIGPADLSVSLGVPRQWHDQGFHDVVSLIIKETRGRGLSVGCHYSFERAVEYQKKWVQEGANLIIHASDVSLYTRALTDDVRQLSEALSAPDGKRTADGRNDADVDV
ncbi:2-keto-3-deoxy-L-rhamnonate aldolase-like [Sycon ciliatum]|uniref:2-keto-3-deoxy-L-rhamnonate aldolase-like n=1 Tax=Sycon ciliatum TaxID=27933 RepID=UPI0031F69477